MYVWRLWVQILQRLRYSIYRIYLLWIFFSGGRGRGRVFTNNEVKKLKFIFDLNINLVICVLYTGLSKCLCLFSRFDCTDMNVYRSALSACVVSGLSNVKEYIHQDRYKSDKKLSLSNISLESSPFANAANIASTSTNVPIPSPAASQNANARNSANVPASQHTNRTSATVSQNANRTT